MKSSLRQVCGIHACGEVFKVRPWGVKQVWFQHGAKKSSFKSFFEIIEKRNIPLQFKSKDSLNKVSSSHQGLVVFVEGGPKWDWSELREEKKEPYSQKKPCKSQRKIILAVDQIKDPRNLGALLRTSWLLGVWGVLISRVNSVGLTATVHKVASGALEHLPVESSSCLDQDLKRLQKCGFWVYGLAAAAKESLYGLKIHEKSVWVVGGEQKGLRKPVLNVLDHKVAIFQKDSKASYNLSVAAALALGENCRQNMGG